MCNEKKGKNDSKGKTLKKGEVSQFGEALRAYQSWQLLGNCTGCAATTAQGVPAPWLQLQLIPFFTRQLIRYCAVYHTHDFLKCNVKLN